MRGEVACIEGGGKRGGRGGVDGEASICHVEAAPPKIFEEGPVIVLVPHLQADRTGIAIEDEVVDIALVVRLGGLGSGQIWIGEIDSDAEVLELVLEDIEGVHPEQEE